LCELFARTDRHEQSLAAGRKALEIAKRLGLMRLLARCHSYLSQAYESAGNFQQALEEMKAYTKIKDQSIQLGARQTFKALQRYQEIERHALEKEQYKQQTIELGEANEQMQAQQATLEYTITQFRHSIAYASRIQQAMLPPIETIGRHFDDNFVMFMPRDGVSGDFYYLQALEDDSVIVAAADCTGHGVPGALLGMLGYSLLNLIVNERGYHRPDKILKLLDLYMREVLCRQNPGQKMDDGMDISLIHYQPRRRVFQYAGAMNALYWARHGQVQKVEADRVGIGGTYKGLKHFHLNEIPVERGDCIYLFTDGYHDQFGPGKTRQKKFSPKRMREILADVHELNMQQQHDYLKAQLKAHQAELTQTDDILVMGLRI
ncbi:MAG: PP2C family protein-serine/threonine phosphatase, partial [Bacteroidota bacterium]